MDMEQFYLAKSLILPHKKKNGKKKKKTEEKAPEKRLIVDSHECFVHHCLIIINYQFMNYNC